MKYLNEERMVVEARVLCPSSPYPKGILSNCGGLQGMPQRVCAVGSAPSLCTELWSVWVTYPHGEAGVIRSTSLYNLPNKKLLKYTRYSNSSRVFLPLLHDLDGMIPFGSCGTSLCKVKVVRLCALERIWARVCKEKAAVPHIGGSLEKAGSWGTEAWVKERKSEWQCGGMCVLCLAVKWLFSHGLSEEILLLPLLTVTAFTVRLWMMALQWGSVVILVP